MLTIEQLKQRLSDVNMSYVAKKTGLNKHTIYRLLKKDANNLLYSYLTVVKLSNYFEQRDAAFAEQKKDKQSNNGQY